MIPTLIDRLIAWAKKTPYFDLYNPDGTLYMERWLLSPRYKFGFAARIHKIHTSDLGRDYHDHPWAYLTIILDGGYYENKPVYDKSDLLIGVSRVWYGKGSILLRSAKSIHRLEVIEGRPATTLFITAPWQQDWGFRTHLQVKQHHKDYQGY